LTEEEVTIIKLKLRPTTKVVANKTQLEKNLLIQQAFGFLKEQEESLRLELTEAKKQLTLQAPKVKLAEECIRDKDKHYSITNAGKQLGLKRTFIFNLMIEKHLLTSEKLPTQHALNRDFISLRTNTIGGKNYPQAVMTMENIYNFKKSYEKDFINGSV
jgi:phage antirepressor YoqD-like protein